MKTRATTPDARLAILVSQLCLGLQSLAEFTLPPLHPYVPPALAQRPQDLVVQCLDPFRVLLPLLAGDNIELGCDLRAVELHWQVIDVLAKGILNLTADEQQPEDDVTGCDGSRDRDPSKVNVQLEGQEEHVDPGDLADGDGVCDGERRGQDSFGASEDVV
ncbi:hypothetical protein VP1G_11376 [Cytospora mali]|uniref:Secreted protein n=1 Tax=Cytospora mali TaxID=578113 RepID=A0A194VCY5_CYTMA|nr:hypothetical protein VP1G_11376 [Valsa mali var. pyri (nom. inval.)]